MLGKQIAALGTVAVEQPLTGQAAAGEGQQIDLGVIPGADALGIKGGVDQHHNSLLLIGAQQWPGEGDEHRDAADCQREPPEADTACKGHTDKNKHENQRNAQISG